jgi:hypothetical protein
MKELSDLIELLLPPITEEQLPQTLLLIPPKTEE